MKTHFLFIIQRLTFYLSNLYCYLHISAFALLTQNLFFSRKTIASLKQYALNKDKNPPYHKQKWLIINKLCHLLKMYFVIATAVKNKNISFKISFLNQQTVLHVLLPNYLFSALDLLLLLLYTINKFLFCEQC